MLGLRNRLIWLAVAALVLIAAAVAAGAPEQVRTFGPAGQGDGNLGPHTAGIAVAADGTVFVADFSQGEVDVFDVEGQPAGTWGDFDRPTALAVDGDRVLVADAKGVHAHTADGSLIADLGGPASAAGLAVGPAGIVYASGGGHVAVLGGPPIGTGELVQAAGIAFGPDGDLYVADAGDDAVKRFTTAGEMIDGWPAVDPAGLAFAPDGTLYVAESGHRVGHFLDDGVRTDNIGGDGPLNVPRGVAVDCRGAVYVVDNSNPRGHVFAEPGTAAPPCPPPPPPPPPPAVQEIQGTVEEEQPVVGRTARATVLRGDVLVGKGNSRRRLNGRVMLPIGEQIDTSDGAVRLEFEAIGADRAAYGKLMEAEFDSGEFTIHQAQDDSLVEIALTGAAPAGARSSSLAQAARRRKRGRRGGSVWTRARGRFRTRGNHGAATVRGTRWLTDERRRGTFFRVTEGSIAVQDFRTGRTRILNAPDSYLAKAPCVSRRRFRIRLRPPRGTVVTGVRVTLDGRRIKVRRRRRLTALIDLRGRPKGRVVVRITVRTADGRTLRGVRDYHTCRKDSGESDIPEL